MKPALTPIDSLSPSAYNPRKADAERLDLVELSLRKFGWLLPIYADVNGEILSGHQRHLVAKRIGATMVPVVRVPFFKVDRRMGINVLYNRATNDMYKTRSTKELKNDLFQKVDELRQIQELPDIPVDAPEWYPILNQKPIATMRLAKLNERWPEAHAVQMASYLKSNGLPQLPVICTSNYQVLNGLARLTFAIQEKYDTVNAVFVKEEFAQHVQAMMNLLTMDYNIQERYEDLLRYNSFRRKNQRQTILSTVFVEDLVRHYINTGNRVGAFQLKNEKHVEMWKKYYGTRVIDFGAGLCDKTKTLCDMGVDAVAFEPFFLGEDNENIDTEGARKLTLKFLERVADGTEWDSIFISHVFNSVPFLQDRLHIMTIIAALCSPHTKCHSVAVSSESDRWYNHTRGDLKKSHDTSSRGFVLDYEPRTVLSDIALKPKIQKYHTETEFAELMRHSFKNVDTFMTAKSGCVQAVADNAKPVDVDALRAALEFEFNVPHPGDLRLGLAEEAKVAFSKRLGIQL